MCSSPMWILLCLAGHLAAAQAIQGDISYCIFHDNIEWLLNESNIVPVS